MFIHPRSSLERPTRFQTEMGSVYSFSDQNGGKTLPDGAAHSFMAYIREYPPPPGQKHRKFSGSACSRIPLESCVFGACSGNRSVFILDPPLKWQLFGLAKSHYGCWFSWFRYSLTDYILLLVTLRKVSLRASCKALRWDKINTIHRVCIVQYMLPIFVSFG